MKKIAVLIFTLLFLVSCEAVKNDKFSSSSNNKKTYTTKYCKRNKKLWAKSFLGKQAPEFEVEGWIGKKPEFKDGKFILIDFWATHCPQCRRAIPELNKIAEKYGDKITVIGISSEPEEVVKRMKNPKINYYSAYDRANVLKRRYQVRAIPHIVIIAPDNTVVWEGFPFLGSDRLDLNKVGKIINAK